MRTPTESGKPICHALHTGNSCLPLSWQDIALFNRDHVTWGARATHAAKSACASQVTLVPGLLPLVGDCLTVCTCILGT